MALSFFHRLPAKLNALSCDRIRQLIQPKPRSLLIPCRRLRLVVPVIQATHTIAYVAMTYRIRTRYAYRLLFDMRKIFCGIKIEELARYADFSVSMRNSLACKNMRRKCGYAECSIDMRKLNTVMDLRRPSKFRLRRRQP